MKLSPKGIWPFTHLKTLTIALPLKLLSARDRFILNVLVVITFFLAILDLFGVILIGLIGHLSVTGLSGGPTGNRVMLILEFLRLEKVSRDNQVIIVGLLAAAILIVKTFLSLLLMRKSMFFLALRSAVLSASLINKYFKLPVSKINQRSAQLSIYSLTDGVNTIMLGVIAVSISLISDSVLLIIMSGGLFFVDPIAALGTFSVFVLLAMILYKILHKKVEHFGKEQNLLEIESAQRIYEVIISYRELLVRDRRGFYAQQISALRYKLANGSAQMQFWTYISKYVFEITLVIGVLLLAFYQFTTSTGSRAVATIAIFLAASARIMPAIVRLQQGLLTIKASLAKAKTTLLLIEELGEIPTEGIKSGSFVRVHDNFRPEIKALDISFSYEPHCEVLKKVDFYALPGEFVAIIGSSGAGKTTLVDVLLGALDPQIGEIEISGLPPRLAFSRWPGAVSYVPQDCPIVLGSVKENLGLGFPTNEISEEFCWDSLRIAKLDKFVENLPEQLETQIGDRGSSLSGGQRQRLGIARALMTKPKMLILDEATSSLDPITESEISESLKNLKGELTLIVIAHRLSTVVNADRIYYMEDGVVKGEGSFEQLKKRYPSFLKQAKLIGL